MLTKIGTPLCLILCHLAIFTHSRPADYSYEAPTKVDLSFDVSPANHVSNAKADYGSGLAGLDGIGQIAAIFNGPPIKLESPILEHESIFSKKDSFYTGLHEKFANLFQYKPIVDTIKEADKYGNDGEKFRSLGKFVVGKAEGVANFLNKAVEVPYQAFKAVIQTTNEKLNHLGGKIVGLEK